MRTILQRLQEIFSADRIANSVAHFAPRFVIGLIVFLVFYLLYRVLNFLLARVTRRAQVEPTAATFLLMAVKYVVLIVGLVLKRVVPSHLRRPLITGLVLSGILTLYSYPLVRGFGRSAATPSRLPNNYAAGLVTVLIVVWVAVIVGTVATARLRRR